MLPPFREHVAVLLSFGSASGGVVVAQACSVGMRIPPSARATTTPPDALPNESRTATCSLNGGSMHVLERRRLELELGPGGDHDVSYTFALPLLMPQVLTWMRLLAQVQRGEVEP